MPSNGLLRQYEANKRSRPPVAAGSGSQAVGAIGGVPHYSVLTPSQLSLILRTTAANQSGTTQTVSLYSAIDNYVEGFAIGNDRFVIFATNGSDYPCAVVADASVTLSMGSAIVLESAATTIVNVTQNPVNPLQFIILLSSGKTVLLTLAATGTTGTVSTHTVGIGTFYSAQSNRQSAVIWSDSGAYCVVAVQNTSTNRMNFVLYTVSGTTLTYVSNTAGTPVLSGVSLMHAAKTGNANNEFTASCVNGSSYGHIYKVTFTSSTVTIVTQYSHANGGYATMPSNALICAVGDLHFYPDGTAPYPTSRKVFDASGTGNIYSSDTINNGAGLFVDENRNSRVPFGQNMSWTIHELSSPRYTYAGLQGVGCGYRGKESLYTRGSATELAMMFIPSHNYSKLLVVSRDTGGATWYFNAFNTATS